MRNKTWLTIIVMVLLMGYVMSFNYGGCGKKSRDSTSTSGSSGITIDVTSPTVSSINPANRATDVLINRKIAATFSEAMYPATINATTFTLTQGTTPITGDVTYAAVGFTATFTPAGNLASSTVYTATLTTGVRGLAGNALASNYVWGFTTGAAADTTPPTVSLVNPANSATGVLINQIIAATFSEAMDPATISALTFTLAQGTTPVAGTVTYAAVGATVTFAPASNLASSTLYTATLTTGEKDLAGNALASNYTWSFTTGAAADTTPPTVSLVNPANSATGVLINGKIVATFSEAMDPAAISALTFTLAQGTTPITGSVTYDAIGGTATFAPASNLASSTVYTATLTTGAKDLAGNALASSYAWSFTTGVAADTTPPTVSSKTPANLATGVFINRKITATFSEAMDPDTITTMTFTLAQGTTPVVGAVTYATVGATATFTPAGNLASSTLYTATLTTGAKDLAGNALASSYAWSFTTGAAADTTPPTVSFIDPANSATGVVINKTIAATFSEAMDPAAISALTFTLAQGTTPVAGAVTYDAVNATATFAPAGNLASSTLYTATLTIGAKDLAGNALASSYVWSFTTGAAADTTPPTVSSKTPANLATGVVINTTIAATFSEAMDPAKITALTFTLMQGTTPINGVVTYAAAGYTATFSPASNLAYSTLYTATLTTGVKDPAGNALASNNVWSFTTAALADTTPPTVSLVNPANLATGVVINTTIAATFSEAMNSATISATTFTLMQGTTPITGVVTYVTAGSTAIFTPGNNLASSTVYTATLTTGVKDSANNALASNYVWSFTTGAAADTTPPTVTFVNPANSATGVYINKTIAATFSEAMDPATISATTFTLTQGTAPISGTVTYVAVGATATFTPVTNLAYSSVYVATLTTVVKDMAGNALTSNYTWTFTTGTMALNPVVLGTAGNFAVLAKTGVSITGAGAVVGNIGLSPAAATFITGFGLIADASNTFSTSSLVTGTIYAADYAPPTPANMTTAISDMEIAYTDAAGRTLPDFTELYAGDISGRTLVPGLYKWGTGLLINNSVTLAGGADDVWIFQIAQDLTVGNGAIVTLSGGAQPKNIFWQVAGQATLGTTADFKGIILCQTLIEMKTGAAFNGRALAQTAVTLDANAVTAP